MHVKPASKEYRILICKILVKRLVVREILIPDYNTNMDVNVILFRDLE
jgi:hypothetical protein